MQSCTVGIGVNVINEGKSNIDGASNSSRLLRIHPDKARNRDISATDDSVAPHFKVNCTKFEQMLQFSERDILGRIEHRRLIGCQLQSTCNSTKEQQKWKVITLLGKHVDRVVVRIEG